MIIITQSREVITSFDSIKLVTPDSDVGEYSIICQGACGNSILIYSYTVDTENKPDLSIPRHVHRINDLERKSRQIDNKNLLPEAVYKSLLDRIKKGGGGVIDINEIDRECRMSKFDGDDYNCYWLTSFPGEMLGLICTKSISQTKDNLRDDLYDFELIKTGIPREKAKELEAILKGD